MLKVINPGLFSSIQDRGRFGYREIAVPQSGSMDHISAGIANALLDNHVDCAVIETTLHGPILEFQQPTTIAISGAEMSATLNERLLSNSKAYQVKKGDILKFGKLRSGVRCYLAVQGGFQTEKILNSRSFYTGITSKNRLAINDFIVFGCKEVKRIKTIGGLQLKNQFFETSAIEVYKGPEFEHFSTEEQQKLLAFQFHVSNRSNRMGYFLDELVVKHAKSIITSPVIPGTVQLTPSGQLIVLMKDAQTTGGYPRVFQLTEKSIAIMAQKKVGDPIHFSKID